MNRLDAVFSYHRRTKHHFDRLARSLGRLDWANQPEPYRRYPGAAHVPLALDRGARALPYEALDQPQARPPVPLKGETLSDFFRNSLALSAWKQSGRNRWALRVNPSSGALHPTEAYLATDVLEHGPGLYHYVSESHTLECRASFSQGLWRQLLGGAPAGSFLLGLSFIAWREAWKYGERAFRYCQQDAGHAIAALRLSAVLCGWQLKLLPTWSSDDVSALLGLDRHADFAPEEPEEPQMLALVAPNSVPVDLATAPPPDAATFQLLRSAAWHGQANRLSRQHVPWTVNDEVAAATRLPRLRARRMEQPRDATPGRLPGPDWSVDAQQIIQQRRSCLALDGRSAVARDVFLKMIGRTLPGPHPPWDALFGPARIHLALFVHRVEGLAPGLYCLVRDPEKESLLQECLRERFLWQRPAGVAPDIPLYLLLEGDARDVARAVSCHQEIAADGFFAAAMLAEFAGPLGESSPWIYRRLHWEAGLVGQVLYLEAEAAGARSTGIGCYFDDPTHEVLGLEDDRLQDLYHFTVGMPVDDPRLQTLPPYWHRGADARGR